MNVMEKFQVKGKVALFTGGAGLLGKKHGEAILEGEGIPVLIDLNDELGEAAAKELSEKYNKKVFHFAADITKKEDLAQLEQKVRKQCGEFHILINNAAVNPKVEDSSPEKPWSRYENFPEECWDLELAVGLKGAFLCSQVFGTIMAAQGEGVILNISSDLGVIAPDQRIYRQEGLEEDQQPVKPVTYSVIKHGLIGLTKYMATYWAEKGIRVNAICPGGIYNNQPHDFVERLTNLIPMGRMANADEYKAGVLFLVSEASSYMTGSVISMDGGRTCW